MLAAANNVEEVGYETLWHSTSFTQRMAATRVAAWTVLRVLGDVEHADRRCRVHGGSPQDTPDGVQQPSGLGTRPGIALLALAVMVPLSAANSTARSATASA
jgi:hypothetical protein